MANVAKVDRRFPAATPNMSVAPSGPVYRAGSLSYTPAGLRAVFAWLLGAEVVFTLIDIIEPRVLPVLLKGHGATDTQIAIIIGSFNAVLQLIIMPPLGYWTDRLRTRWGRRIPVLFWVTPFVTLTLALTPFAPEIAAWLQRFPAVAAWMNARSVTPVILVFGALVFLYRVVQTMTNTTFFGLLRDVVPDTHMGRFLALFRVFGAAGTAIVTYWLLGLTNTHSKPMFLGIALLNLVCFSALCWFVREGTYPPAEPNPAGEGAGRLARFWAATVIFVKESYRHPVYLWIYFVRICLYSALLGLSGFTIFFPQYELGMSLTEIGKMLTWPLLIWIVIAYPVGRLVDSRGAARVLNGSLLLITAGYAGTFFLVVGPKTFLVSSLVTGVAYWIVMMAQLKLTQEVFHPQRYSQLAGANTIVQSIAIALLVSPACGWILDGLKGWSHPLAVPAVGEVMLGPYRIVNLLMAGCYLLAWFGLNRVRHHMRKHTGAEGYVAPL
jgi:maltose/moltooligosaccharide transporter